MLRQVASRSSQSLWHAAGGSQASAWGGAPLARSWSVSPCAHALLPPARRFAGGKVDAGDTHPDFQPVSCVGARVQSAARSSPVCPGEQSKHGGAERARLHRKGTTTSGALSVAKTDRAHSSLLALTQDVAANDILVFMKGTPAMPQCGFSNIVCRVLDGYGESLRSSLQCDRTVTPRATHRRQVCQPECARGPRAAAGRQVIHGVAHYPAGVCRRRVRGALLVAVTSDASQCDSRAVCREAPTFSWACTTAASWRSCLPR